MADGTQSDVGVKAQKSILPHKDLRTHIDESDGQQPHDNGGMTMRTSRPWGLYVISCLTALLATASAVYWALAIPQPTPPRVSALTPVGGAATTDTRILANALDGGHVQDSPITPTAPSLYQLLGVVAGPVGKGFALLVVGNAPPKAYTVGAELGDGQVLQAVSARGAKIGSTLQGKTTVELSLPKASGT
jgi:general secretion pathway protein C